MRVVITDANIFIDLDYCGLLSSFFVLDLEVKTTSLVLDELEETTAQLIKGKAEIIELQEADLKAAYELQLSSRFTFTDRSILYLAQRDSMMVFSGEKMMRKWCQEREIEFHGIIYIMELFISENILDSRTIADHLENLLTYNEWLPIEICLKMIALWKK